MSFNYRLTKTGRTILRGYATENSICMSCLVQVTNPEKRMNRKNELITEWDLDIKAHTLNGGTETERKAGELSFYTVID